MLISVWDINVAFLPWVHGHFYAMLIMGLCHYMEFFMVFFYIALHIRYSYIVNISSWCITYTYNDMSQILVVFHVLTDCVICTCFECSFILVFEMIIPMWETFISRNNGSKAIALLFMMTICHFIYLYIINVFCIACTCFYHSGHITLSCITSINNDRSQYLWYFIWLIHSVNTVGCTCVECSLYVKALTQETILWVFYAAAWWYKATF